jgi:hypothetical protein
LRPVRPARASSARRGAAALALALGAWIAPLAAQPAEYRLKVASVHEDAFLSFLQRGETRDGATGPGLAALVARLDAGDFPRGGLLLDRPLRPAPREVANAWGATPLQIEVKRGGGRGDPWDEVRWQGTPGEHSVWLVEPGHRQPQDVRRIALQGSQGLRHRMPYTPGGPTARVAIASSPLAFVRGLEQRAAAWAHFARVLDLGDDVACVVAVSEDGIFPDRVRLIVRHTDRPARHLAVLAWGVRELDEHPSGPSGR